MPIVKNENLGTKILTMILKIEKNQNSFLTLKLCTA